MSETIPPFAERPNLGELREQLKGILESYAKAAIAPKKALERIVSIIEQQVKDATFEYDEAMQMLDYFLGVPRGSENEKHISNRIKRIIEQREREALKEACVAMCPLCKGVEGFSKETVLVPAYCQPETYWHVLTTGRQGHDKCNASAIRNLAKLKSQPKVQAGEGSNRGD